MLEDLTSKHWDLTWLIQQPWSRDYIGNKLIYLLDYKLTQILDSQFLPAFKVNDMIQVFVHQRKNTEHLPTMMGIFCWGVVIFHSVNSVMQPPRWCSIDVYRWHGSRSGKKNTTRWGLWSTRTQIPTFCTVVVCPKIGYMISDCGNRQKSDQTW